MWWGKRGLKEGGPGPHRREQDSNIYPLHRAIVMKDIQPVFADFTFSTFDFCKHAT